MSQGRKSDLGKKGEDAAVSFLKGNGFKILERNWKHGHKEIDIICMDGRTIVFVEVKAGRSGSFGSPLEKVNRKKQENILQVAKSFAQQRDCSGFDFRFDVISVDSRGGKAKVNHIRNAFMAQESC